MPAYIVVPFCACACAVPCRRLYSTQGEQWSVLCAAVLAGRCICLCVKSGSLVSGGGLCYSGQVAADSRWMYAPGLLLVTLGTRFPIRPTMTRDCLCYVCVNQSSLWLTLCG